VSKQFDAVQYAADDPAKHTVIAWLRSNRIEACVNPDQFGIDILASRNSDKFEIEVEVKHNWKGKHYPFDTVHISSRKEITSARTQSLCLVSNSWLRRSLSRTRPAPRAKVFER